MAGNKTLMMIKPDAVGSGYIGNILKMVNDAGFHIMGMKLMKLTPESAGQFYAVHKEKPFYHDLINFMTSGSIVAVILEREDAIASFRKLIGATDPTQSDEGTIRNLYGTNVERNAVHGSDSDENATIEIDFFASALGN